MSPLEKGFWILFLICLIGWACLWMFDDWHNEGDDR